MKIAFIISSINSKSNGNGGHYFSLIETVKMLSINNEVVIYNIGNSPAIALKNTEFKLISIVHKKIAFTQIYKDLLVSIKEEQPEIIHSFDAIAYFWGRLVSSKLNIKSCLTKCGGINQIYFPFCDNFILYSKENFDYYQSKNKFKNSNLFLIPNRINTFPNDKKRIIKLKGYIKEEHLNSFKFLRISRISNYYIKSTLQIINLVNDLNELGINCIFIYIGSVEDKTVLSELKDSSNQSYVYIFTQDEFTNNSKELIDFSDAVLGTGRSYMEAASKGKIMLAYNPKGKYPLLINDKNFSTAFKYNFSERIETKDKNTELSLFSKVINDENYKIKLKDFSIESFSKFFDSSRIEELHKELYININLKAKYNILDTILNGLFVLKNYLKI